MRRARQSGTWTFSACVVLGTACAAATQPAAPAAAPPHVAPATAQPAAPNLAAAERAFDASRYGEAEATFRVLMTSDAAGSARLGLARVLMITGRNTDAQALLVAALEARAEPDVEASTLLAESLWASGNLEAARTRLESLADRPEARRARLMLGEILIATGRRSDAEPPLMTLVEDYNEDRIKADDGAGLALVGRAAHLLRSPHDANDAFNAAERAAPGLTQTLLWRAELFLEKHDPGHAEEVVAELLERAPEHPEALVWMAHVKLEQALDFDAARALCDRALAINPHLAHAYFVLAGLSLRDLDFEQALSLIDRGLASNPADLELMSLRAAVGFLSDDLALFEAARQKVFAANASFSRFYSIVGEYAEWEHRYARIVEMMRDAVAIDDEDAEAHAALGLNLIRAGQDIAGVQSLRRAIAKDPFNVRVFNTLNLFEQVIPESYVTRQSGRFMIRYPKEEAALLERYVPAMLERAWQKFVGFYGFTPSEPIGIELYSKREHFAVRTSGLPQTAIQGVCFGKTLASLTPREESFNLGMTLWHELAHVFHIQMSNSHVPRWLTEGLAEYETLIERPEWRRHQDPDLYLALRAQRLPRVASMNHAFSHAANMQDMATAYYASSQIAVMLVERFGRPKVDQLLRLHARGVTTEAALPLALGVDAQAIDREFASYLAGSLTRYRQQFVPLDVRGELPSLVLRAKAAPTDVRRKLEVVLGALAEQQLPLALSTWAEAAKLDASAPDVRFLGARLLAAQGKQAEARAELARIAGAGHDGYAVQMALAELTDGEKQPAALLAVLGRAHELDPSQSEPLRGLWRLAQRASDVQEERRVLERLALLEEHDVSVYRRLLELLMEQKDYAAVVALGQAAVYADIEGILTHARYATALAAQGQVDAADFEFQSALSCPGAPEQLAEAHLDYAEFLEGRGKHEQGQAEREQARRLVAPSAGPSLSPPLTPSTH